MAVNEIIFKELPFQPDFDQVFYIENGYDGEVNEFICSHYGVLKSKFRQIGMDFYYLPFLLREHDVEAKVRYYAPYLSTKLLAHRVQSNAFVPYISDAEVRANLRPSFIFGGRKDDNCGDVRFLTVACDNLINGNAKSIDQLMRLVLSTRDAFYEKERERCIQEARMCEPEMHSLCHEAEDIMACEIPMPCSSAAPDFGAVPVPKSRAIEERESRKEGKPTRKPKDLIHRFFYHSDTNEKTNYDECNYIGVQQPTQDELEEKQSLIETTKVLRELRMTVQKLRLEGVSLMAIHEFIDKQEPLSRMTITPDYRIFLPDYNDMEIEMGALPKAIYFLYLRYPDGIIYKHMPDYFSELLNIYKQLRPNTDEARLNLTITKVVNPLGNALNENIARIRKAFVEKFDEHLANNYIITGERGLQYSIPLDRDLITWEE